MTDEASESIQAWLEAEDDRTVTIFADGMELRSPTGVIGVPGDSLDERLENAALIIEGMSDED